jgi:hypothetical protein
MRAALQPTSTAEEEDGGDQSESEDFDYVLIRIRELTQRIAEEMGTEDSESFVPIHVLLLRTSLNSAMDLLSLNSKRWTSPPVVAAAGHGTFCHSNEGAPQVRTSRAFR